MRDSELWEQCYAAVRAAHNAEVQGGGAGGRFNTTVYGAALIKGSHRRRTQPFRVPHAR